MVLDNLSWDHLAVLGIAALFVLGPERLPEAAEWLARMVKQVRSFAGDAQVRMQQEIGTELDQLREPFEQLREPLRQLRHLDPRGAAMTMLVGTPPCRTSPSASPLPARPGALAPRDRPLASGESPPIDPDAT